MRSPALAAALVVFLVPATLAQQFQWQAGALPGPDVWSEGVEAFDADGDGDLDLTFANGDGFSTAGTQRQNVLLINKVNQGMGWVDESVARYGVLLGNSKMVTTVDVDLDGDVDVVFANAFGQLPQLMINDGTGFFTNQAATRLPNITLNAFCAIAGDVDDDGDPDLVFSDAGASTFSGSGGQTRLYRNDGSGFFTDATATNMPVVLSVAAQDLATIDIDNDWDIDIVLVTRGTTHYFFRNGGTGVFTSQPGVLPAGSGAVYEADWADLDNDADLDGFFVSLSGFSEGTARNNLVPGGTLGFTNSTATVVGSNGFDDNEIAFLDANNDGFLDVIVGSLGASQERLYLNSGSFAFNYQATGFTSLTDSTLDVAILDYDGDGRYDVATAQGESGAFTNRLYRNVTGLPDTTAPVVDRLEALGTTTNTAGPWVARAHVRDSVYDDGVTYLSCQANYRIAARNGVFLRSAPMRHSGGGIFRAALANTGGAAWMPGATVSYEVQATDRPGNVGTSATLSFAVCGYEAYGTGLGGANTLALAGLGSTTLGGTVTATISGAPAGAPGLLALALTRASLPLFGGTLLVSGLVSTFGFVANGSGQATLNFPVPPDPLLAMAVFDIQAGALDGGAPQGVALSNGLEAGICP